MNFDLVMFRIYLCATYELEMGMGSWEWYGNSNKSQYWECK